MLFFVWGPTVNDQAAEITRLEKRIAALQAQVKLLRAKLAKCRGDK